MKKFIVVVRTPRRFEVNADNETEAVALASKAASLSRAEWSAEVRETVGNGHITYEVYDAA